MIKAHNSFNYKHWCLCRRLPMKRLVVVAGTKPGNFTFGAKTFIKVFESNIVPAFTLKITLKSSK